MQVQTFLGKASVEGLHQLDNHVNEWMRRRNITPVHIHQCFGTDNHHDGRQHEPVIITSIWYEQANEEE
jgi:ribosomal protein S19